MLICIGCGASVEAGAHRWNEGINDSLVLCADCWEELIRNDEELEADKLEARAQQQAACDEAESEAEG